MKTALVSIAWFLAAILLTGCGGPAKNYKYHSGKGKVEGPIPAGSSIMFFPEGDPNYVANGKIEGDGSFLLSTNLAKPERTVKGVPEGTYEVRIRIPNSMKEIGAPELPAKVRVDMGQDLINIKMQQAEE